MKQLIVIVAAVLTCSIAATASNWKEVDRIEIPKDTAVYYDINDAGKFSYYIIVNDFSVSVSKTNAEKFVAGKIRLELVKWYNIDTGRYKYTTRQRSTANIDLKKVFK